MSDSFLFNPISAHRFSILTMARHPWATFFVKECAFYSSQDESILATIIQDSTDNEYSIIFLGRDQDRRFRWIGGSLESYDSLQEAKDDIYNTFIKNKLSGKIFPQESLGNPINIFISVGPEDRLHESFVLLRDSPGYSAAKYAISEIANAFKDKDGNFIEQFQTTGFDSRVFELAMFAFLYEEHFAIDENSAYPDFICSKFGSAICIECTTVNANPDFDLKVFPTSREELLPIMENYIPLKFSKTLYSKLEKIYSDGKHYWEKPSVIGKPLIFAIEDFHFPASMTWCPMAIASYLYGYRYKAEYDAEGKLRLIPLKIDFHSWNGITRPSGFFNLTNSENISAVIFTNSATISKFQRMGTLADFGDHSVKVFRHGLLYDSQPNATEGLSVNILVAPPYEETWGDGMNMFHNPNALHPIDENLFPSIAHHYLQEDKTVISKIPNPWWISSITHICIPNSGER